MITHKKQNFKNRDVVKSTISQHSLDTIDTYKQCNYNIHVRKSQEDRPRFHNLYSKLILETELICTEVQSACTSVKDNFIIIARIISISI